jgi:probable H4MPT-linked C1 transfer pathway protein
LVARTEPDALLIDFGSTTADIIPIKGGNPVPAGFSDAERQTTGELVYTGFTRTAVMGVARRAPFRGQWVTLAREYLATMADVRRILGDLPDGLDQHATADGKGKSLPESLTRFARMLGRDAADGTAAEWAAAAAYVREAQMRSIHDGALQVLSAADLPPGAPVVTAGIGADAVAILALRLGRGSVTFAEFANAGPDVATAATHSAPAVAVAHLASGS